MNIYIRVEALAGNWVKNIALDMLTLSKLLNIGVACNVNGIELYALPNGSVKVIEKQYEDGIAREAEEKASADAIG